MLSLCITSQNARYFEIQQKRKSSITGCRLCNMVYKKCSIFLDEVKFSIKFATGSSSLALTIISYKLKIKFKHNWENVVSKKYDCLSTANTRAVEIILLVHENTVGKGFKLTIHRGPALLGSYRKQKCKVLYLNFIPFTIFYTLSTLF